MSRQIDLNPGCRVMQSGTGVTSWCLLSFIGDSSWQQMHSAAVGMITQWPHVHLKHHIIQVKWTNGCIKTISMMRRLKIANAVGSVLLVIFAVVGGTVLGLDPDHKPSVVTRSVQLSIEDEIIEETVEVDKEKDTEIFRTVSSTGTSFVIMDMKTGLSAYRFDEDEKCYILYESLEDSEDTAELLEDLEQMEEGEVDAAERRSEMFLSVDEERGQVEPSELSDSMLEFCEGLQTHWADKSSTGPIPTPESTAEEEHDEADIEMEGEVLPGQNGTNAVLEREKRAWWVRPVLGLVCRWTTRNVCGRTCRNVCGKRRRRALADGEPEQEVKKRAKRGPRNGDGPTTSSVCRAASRPSSRDCRSAA